MPDERRYDEEEMALILERALTSDQELAPAAAPEGMTLADIQDIAAEVGIPPERISRAAQAVSAESRSVAPVAPATLLGAPRSVSRTVQIERALTDDEWMRLVAELRQTFAASGSESSQGPLRSWHNGNLQVHVEPDASGYRVRMQTLKGNAVVGAMAGAAVSIFGMVMFLAMMIGGDANARQMAMSILMSMGGLAQVIYTRASLPRWALERGDQMERLAERIPRLLEE